MTSSGRFLYQSGSEVPVGMGMLVPDGMAVLSTDSMESCVGFMSAGSMARSRSILAPLLFSSRWIRDAMVVVATKKSVVSLILPGICR